MSAALGFILTFCAASLLSLRGAEPYTPRHGDPLVEPWRWSTFLELCGLGVRSLAEGGDGLIWFSTGDNVWSFDGIDWQSYSSSEVGLGPVEAIVTGPDGELYLGGRSGIGTRTREGWRVLLPAGDGGFPEIKKLAVASDGALWAATSQGALSRRGSTWTLHTSAELGAACREWCRNVGVEIREWEDAERPAHEADAVFPCDLVGICEDRNGRIWMAASDGRVAVYSPEFSARPGQPAWRFFGEQDGLEVGGRPSLLARQDGTVWVFHGHEQSGARASVFDQATWKTVSLEEAGYVGPGGWQFPIETRDGVILLSGRYVVAAFRDGKWRRYERPEVSIPTAQSLLLETRDGTLWIAGPETEVVRIEYETPRWTTLEDLNFQCDDGAGSEWFLHRSGAVVVHLGEQWLRYGVEDGLMDSPVVLMITRSGRIWAAGSHQGTAATAYFDREHWVRQIHDRFSWGIDWRGVVETIDGSVWFSASVDSRGPPAHRQGLLEFRDGAWHHHHQPGREYGDGSDDDPRLLLPATQRPEPIGKFLCLGVLGDGSVWAGRNLVVRQVGGSWDAFVPPPGLQIGIVESMLSARDGSLWIGSRQFGAFRFDGREWKQFRGRDSLVTNSVHAFTQTADGTIWAATDRGYSRFDGDTWTSDVLSEVPGLSHEAGRLRADRSGAVWVDRFASEWMRRAWSKAGPVDLETCLFQAVAHRPDGGAPETEITSGADQVSYPGNLSVLWRGAVRWRANQPGELQFSYRVDGGAWSPYRDETGRAFFDMATGRHRLEVRARDRDFNADATPAVLEFTVLPPVWRQPWFIFVMLGLGGSAVVLGARVFLQQKHLWRANRSLAAEVEERRRAEAAARDSEALLTEAQRVGQIGSWSWTASTGEVVWSSEYRRILGWPAERPVPVAAETFAVYTAEGAESLKAAFVRCRDAGEAFELDAELAHPAEGVRWIAVRGEAVVDGEGRVVGVRGTAQNITERKRAENELRKLWLAVEQTSASIIITDRTGVIEYVNPRFTEVTGYEASEAVGQTPRLLKSGEIPPQVYRDLWRTITRGGVWRGELQNRCKDGRLFWEDVTISPVRDAVGEITHFLAIKDDITAQRIAEGRIREQAALLDETLDAILVMGLDRRFRYGNRGAVRSFGLPMRELLEADPASVLFPGESARFGEVCDETLRRGSWSGETNYTTQLGQSCRAMSRWTVVCDHEGRPTSFLIVNTDVTEQKRLEEQFLRAQRMESIGTLASGVAHDLNNILAPIMMSTDMLRDLARNDDDREMIELIEQCAQRGAGIVKQLLTFGRGTAGERVAVQLRSLLKEIVSVVRETFPKSIAVQQEIARELWVVQADPTQIHQVLLNLCLNARDAMPHGGTLSIAAENVLVDEDYARGVPDAHAGPYVAMEVRDAGTGITREHLEKIFDPFFTTKAVGKGTGLGLSTVLGIVRSHQGFLTVDSKPGHGTRFRVCLPASEGAEVGAIENGPGAVPRGAGELILVVDDEGSVRSMTQRALESAGFRVVSACDGVEALQALARTTEPVRLVVTDMVMPVMDGRSLIHALRQRMPSLPVIGISGLPDQELALSGSGARFIGKPLSVAHLVSLVHDCLRDHSVA